MMGALQELDPTGKFSSVADVWSFNAADVSTGASVAFSSCCNAQVHESASCAAVSALRCWLVHTHTQQGHTQQWRYHILST